MLVAGLASVPVLAACGAAATPTPAPKAPEKPAEKPAAAATKPAEKPAAAPAGQPYNARRGQKISHLRENSFIADNDEYLKTKLLPAYEQETGNKLEIEWISVNDQNPKILSAIEAKAGPDLIDWGGALPHTFGHAFVDVSEIAKKREAEAGPWYPTAVESARVEGVWRGIPYRMVPNAMTHREDWFKENGIEKFPDTWQDLLVAGEKLKKAGKPGGLALGPATGDANSAAYSILWAFGGKEVEPDGKTVAISSKETRAAVEFYKELFNKAMTPDVLSWGDPHNNRAYLAGQISWTQNGASIYYVAKKEQPEIAKNTNNAPAPKGPAGAFTLTGPGVLDTLSYSKVRDETMQFVDWVTDLKQSWDWIQVGDGYFVGVLKKFEDSPMWGKDPKMLEFKRVAPTAHTEGFPAKPSKASGEAILKFIIKDMFAKAISGESTDSAVTWAEGQLKEIYAKN
jgi:multiple sugar transport system substrate-binding protein